MEHSKFVVKCYNKQELAQMYFPDLTIRASVNKLRRWMRRCKPLIFRKAGRSINAVIIESLNDINIKKNYGRLHFRQLP